MNRYGQVDDIEELKDRFRQWAERATEDLTSRWIALNEEAEERALAQGLDYYKGPKPGKDIISDLDSFPLPPGWYIEQGSKAYYKSYPWRGETAKVYHDVYNEEGKYMCSIIEVYPVEDYSELHCFVHVEWSWLL